MNAPPRKSIVTLSNPAGLYDPAPNGYSHLAIVSGAKRWLLVAGQGGETADGRLAADFRSQVRQGLANLKTALASAGASTDDVAKLTVLIVDHSEERLHVFGAELEAAFGPHHKPACTLIPVPRLALDGMLFEVEAIAALAD
ncbi:RidA family protein [Vulcaniibacterium tengchongense]|uniref:Enamine deaminase RidA (YjgF/YER057c/UK114 family) n=1 Tax=Vulcaniibacterium tengchongense TaxID=1273429 RepID=A0A3N4VKB8_9GAMM|nr:RidA family protein [Vulcaniibacterium tengchongense]RPE79701.1 enamine deaminase RidA (YjgF/YER057c/UK114 family) [Vulcaniibacterium tengchongense]